MSYCATFYVSDIVLDVLVNKVVDRKGRVAAMVVRGVSRFGKVGEGGKTVRLVFVF